MKKTIISVMLVILLSTFVTAIAVDKSDNRQMPIFCSILHKVMIYDFQAQHASPITDLNKDGEIGLQDLGILQQHMYNNWWCLRQFYN